MLAVMQLQTLLHVHKCLTEMLIDVSFCSLKAAKRLGLITCLMFCIQMLLGWSSFSQPALIQS